MNKLAVGRRTEAENEDRETNQLSRKSELVYERDTDKIIRDVFILFPWFVVVYPVYKRK